MFITLCTTNTVLNQFNIMIIIPYKHKPKNIPIFYNFESHYSDYNMTSSKFLKMFLYCKKCSYINIRNKKILFLKKCSYIQPWFLVIDLHQINNLVNKEGGGGGG